jgi:octaprenyl-diphosphate synthase
MTQKWLQRYFEIIRNKTASLLASSCSAGTWSVTHNPEMAEKMRQFGELAGIAFQMKDDLFDYGDEEIGKPRRNDIKEKKLTLPIIYTLNQISKSRKKELIYMLKNKHKNKTSIQEIITEVKASGGIAYTEEKMRLFRNQALDILKTCPQNEYTEGLTKLVKFTTDRKY